MSDQTEGLYLLTDARIFHLSEESRTEVNKEGELLSFGLTERWSLFFRPTRNISDKDNLCKAVMPADLLVQCRDCLLALLDQRAVRGHALGLLLVRLGDVLLQVLLDHIQDPDLATFPR